MADHGPNLDHVNIPPSPATVASFRSCFLFTQPPLPASTVVFTKLTLEEQMWKEWYKRGEDRNVKGVGDCSVKGVLKKRGWAQEFKGGGAIKEVKTGMLRGAGDYNVKEWYYKESEDRNVKEGLRTAIRGKVTIKGVQECKEGVVWRAAGNCNLKEEVI